MISGAEIMVKCLEAEGVDIVFGYPGAAICPFYDKVYDSSITHILVRLLPLQVRFVPTFSAEMSFRKLTSRELVNRL